MSKKILTLDNVPVINKKIGKIDTIEKLKASTIYSLGDVVEVLGFHTKGDGAHHYRQKVDSTYTGGDAVDCTDGTKWKIIKSSNGYRKEWLGFNDALGGDLWFDIVEKPSISDLPYKDDIYVRKINNEYLVLNVEYTTVDYFKSRLTNNYNYNYSRIHSVNFLDSNRIGISCFGDSITFGMYSQGGDEVVKIGQPTNFGDGSVYEHNQVGTPFPKHLENTINHIYKGLEGFTVNNFGYSGDRSVNGYFRHIENNTNRGFSIIAYGTNDFLYCTGNGVSNSQIYQDRANYNIKEFTKYMKLWIFREIERGNVPILLAPNSQFNTLGQSLYVKAYTRALSKIAEELDVLLIHTDELMTGVPRIDIHPSSLQYSCIGNKLAGLFVGGGYKDIPTIKDGFNSGLQQFISNLNIPSLKQSSQLHTNIGNNISKDSYECINSVDFLTFSFFVDSDICYVFPMTFNGSLSAEIEVYANNKAVVPNREFKRYDRSNILRTSYKEKGSGTNASNLPEIGNYIELTRGLNIITIKGNVELPAIIQGFYACFNDEFKNNSGFIPTMTSLTEPSGEVYGTPNYAGLGESRHNAFNKSLSDTATYENNTLPTIGYKSISSCKPKGYILTNYNTDESRVSQCIKSWEIYGIMYGGVRVLLDARVNVKWDLGQDSKVFYFRKNNIIIESIELVATALNGSIYARLTEFELIV